MAEESTLIARRCQEAKETRRLSLEGCGLRKFPDAVFFLLRDVQLESVSVSGNQLKKIPAKLAEAFSTITCTCWCVYDIGNQGRLVSIFFSSGFVQQ